MEKVGIVCCSNGESPDARKQHDQLRAVLTANSVEIVFSPFLYAGDTPFSGSGKQRAEVLNRFFRDPSIDTIFDVSGGDMANEVLDYLDYEAIAGTEKQFWGYSDLTTVINAIYTKTGKTSVLYQIKNLVKSCGEDQQKRFFSQNQRDLFDLDYRFLRGTELEGTVVGGNIRCLLKLAGTEYFPDLTGKILLLEANSGRVPQMVTYLNQLSQMGAFRKIRGILLGTFTQMQRENCRPRMEELVLEYAGNLPVLKTEQIGHGADARASVIGRNYHFHD